MLKDEAVKLLVPLNKSDTVAFLDGRPLRRGVI